MAAPSPIASQYAKISQPEKCRPSNKTPGSVPRKASSPGDRHSFTNSTAVAIDPETTASGTTRTRGKPADTTQ